MFLKITADLVVPARAIASVQNDEKEHEYIITFAAESVRAVLANGEHGYINHVAVKHGQLPPETYRKFFA